VSKMRSICMKCVSERLGKWLPVDDEDWDLYEKVWCDLDGAHAFGGYRSIHHEAPQGCPYLLEHVLGVRPDEGQSDLCEVCARKIRGAGWFR